jgi:type II secretory pathway pseudopilin PulG
MINDTLIKPIKNYHNKQPTGFTILELLVAFLLVAVISALAIPSYLNQANKARTAEAKMVLGSMNRSQHFYRVENGTFATDVEELRLRFSIGSYQNNAYYTPYYVYTIDVPNNIQEIHHLATPSVTYSGDTKPLVGAVIWQNLVINQYICEANSPNLTPTINSSGDCQNGRLLY